MSNAFYRFLNRFIPRSTVKAEPINAQFDAVEDGFDTVEGQLSRAVKITGLTNGGEITKTASTFLQLDASGNPTASATVPFSPNFSGNRLQSVGTGTAGTDAPNLNQVQQLISEAAFGSPELIAMPSLVGNALKQWRVKADETGTEFAFAVPQTTGTGEILSSSAGAVSWKINGGNLLRFASAGWGDNNYTTAKGWTFGTGGGCVFETGRREFGVLTTGSTAAAGDMAFTSTAEAVQITAGTTYIASCQIACFGGSTANKLTLVLRYLNSSKVQTGSDFTVNVSASTDGIYRRFAVSGAAPLGALYAIVGIKKSVGSLSLGAFYANNFQLEQGSAVTPFLDVRTDEFLRDYTYNIEHNLSGYNVSLDIGQTGAGTAALTFRTNPSAPATKTVSATTRNETVTAGSGTIDWAFKRMIFGKVVGFASVYDNGNTSTAQTIDWYNGQKQKSAITANTTITLTAPDSDIVLDGLRWRGTFSGAGGWTVAFTSTATIRWIGNESPTAANGMVTTAGQELEAVFDWDGTRFVGRWTNM